MKTLIIAEKPSVARDIAAALGGGFFKGGNPGPEYHERDDLVISSAIGHLVELQCPAEQDPGYDLERLPAIPDQFTLAAKEKTNTQLTLLMRLISRNDINAVVNACDAGREGELIFRYIAIYCNCQKPIYRMWLQSMTPGAIMNEYTMMQPSQQRDNLFHAAQSRAEADWLIGINGSRTVSILHQMKTGQRAKNTVGRVQTPTLNLIVERELAIQNFVAKDYYEVHATFAAGPLQYTAKWHQPNFRADQKYPDAKADRLTERKRAEEIILKCQNKNPSSVTDESTEIRTQPPKLFDLTTLQREANKRFGFSASDTLKLAQSLYQTHKVLTYPRTDATALPEDYIQTTQTIISRIAQSQHPLAPYAESAIQAVRPDKRIFNNAKISDHFAIIPTGQLSTNLTADETQLYDLVLRRFIAVFYPASLHLQTIRTTLINNETFRCSGRVLITEGWLTVYGVDPDDENISPLCPIAPGQIFPTTSIKTVALKTRPPIRFTEATLLGAMESAGAVIEDDELREAMKERGLGTPATRAPTIEHLLNPDVAYLTRQKKNLVPTKKALDLIAFLHSNQLTMFTAAQTTGEWEYALRQMEQGKYSRKAFMEGIYQITHLIVDRVKQSAATLSPYNPQSTTQSAIPCPRCQATLAANQNTIYCQCGFKLWKTVAGVSLTETQCTTLLTTRSHPSINGLKSSKSPKTFSAALQLADDLSGKIDLIFSERTQASPENTATNTQSTAHACPACKKPMRQRSSGKGLFWGCTGYPSCKKTLPDKAGQPQV